jgi:hypothetical protein
MDRECEDSYSRGSVTGFSEGSVGLAPANIKIFATAAETSSPIWLMMIPFTDRKRMTLLFAATDLKSPPPSEACLDTNMERERPSVDRLSWTSATHSCGTETTATLTRHVTSVASFFVASIGLPRCSLVSAGVGDFVVGGNHSSRQHFPFCCRGSQSSASLRTLSTRASRRRMRCRKIHCKRHSRDASIASEPEVRPV